MQQEYRQENAPAKPKWQPTVRRARYLGKLPRRYPKVSGLMACYYHYCALLRKAYHGKSTKRCYFLLREDFLLFSRYQQQTKFLWENHIETMDDLLAYKENAETQIQQLARQRKVLYRQKREPEHAAREEKIKSLTQQMKALRHEVYISGNTVLHYHANIRKALSDAVKLKLIPYNPAAEVERPKKDNFVASYYSADELMEVLPIFANTKMELPVMLAAFYGLRRSEVIGLQWSAIDFERKIVTISRTFERINVDGKMVDVSKCRTKNKSSFRSLPLIPAVEQALLKAQKRQHQQMKLCGGSYCKEYKDYICVDDMGHLVTPDYVTRVFHEMLLKNGFRPIRYHDLRHSCASLLIKNKVTMKEVQMWLGHSSFSTTANIYAHIDVDSKMEAANMIASKINLGELPEKKKSPKQKIA